MRRRPRLPLSRLQVDTVQRVLVINSTALGDLLFSTPALRALKERYPAWEVDILMQPGLKPLVQDNPYLTQCWTFPGRSRRLLTLGRQLRARGYDLVIILHGNDPEASLLAWLSGSPFIIGSARSPLSFSYSHGVASGGLLEHAIEKRLNFVRPLGADAADTRMEIFLPPPVKKEAARIVQEHFGGIPTCLIALHPGGSDAYKQWPLGSFATLGRFLQETYGAHLLIIGNRSERPLGEELARQIGAPALVTGGHYNLLTVAALLHNCHLLVGNDSGPLHLGLALKTPSIGVLGADDPRRIGPYRVSWGACLFKEDACPRNPCITKRCPRSVCLEAIRPEEVIRLIQDWWALHYLPAAPKGEAHGG